MSTRELRRAEILGAGVEQDASVDRCGKDTGVELPADEETLETVSRGSTSGSAAPQCGKRFEPREAGTLGDCPRFSR